MRAYGTIEPCLHSIDCSDIATITIKATDSGSLFIDNTITVNLLR